MLNHWHTPLALSLSWFRYPSPSTCQSHPWSWTVIGPAGSEVVSVWRDSVLYHHDYSNSTSKQTPLGECLCLLAARGSFFSLFLSLSFLSCFGDTHTHPHVHLRRSMDPSSHPDRDRNTTRDTSRRPQDDRRSASANITTTLPQHPAAGRNPSYTSAYSSSTPSQVGEPSTLQYQAPSYPITAAPGYPSPTQSTMSRHASSGQQYQLVSPGTPADPRAMSQVSPGFIFVMFPMFAICCWCFDFPG